MCSPRSGPMLSQHRVDRYPAGSVSALSAGGRVDGILESGFGVLLDRPRHNTLVPPPGLEYQPASVVYFSFAIFGILTYLIFISIYVCRCILAENMVSFVACL